VNTRGFRFGQLLDLRDPNFLPGGAKYGDLPGMLALGAPGRLWLSGEGDEALGIIKSIYGKASAADHLTVDQTENPREAAIAWLLAK
jgi:hypothetical protein